MATNESVKNQLTNRNGSAPANGSSIKDFLNSPAVKKRFEEVLGTRGPQFVSSALNMVAMDATLSKCQPTSVLTALMIAATLDLPIEKNLGYAWIVPYKNKQGVYIAQFQMGYKGYIQLALRTGKYRSINALPIYEGELISWNPLTEELVIDFEKRKSDAVIGYAGYFELVNGFRKTVYWTRDQIIKHAKKYSKSYSKEDSPWQDPEKFEGMALKTVIRNMLSKWGILSVEMQKAYAEDIDQKVENGDENVQAIDAEFIVVNEQDDEQIEQNNTEPEQDEINFDGGQAS